tara:strand:+ start:336 stop:674 length:339 start_codon:yes stop_codon:yes gene_type:complete
MGGSGDAPEKTAEQVALENRQRRNLNEEIASSERRLKATARGKLGKQSLLGQPVQPVAAPTGPTRTMIPKSERENEGRRGYQGNRGATRAARERGETPRISMSRNDPRRGSR